ncbi:MAG: PepSY domain-containing protein [Bacteroides sp.]|nr:PepSY domain-containing protein [Bacteroides sp.]
MKKIFLKIHLWLSLPVGLVISILCLTGAILVFETEIKEMTNSGLYFVKEVKGEPLPFEQLVPVVQKQLPDSVTISGVTISPDSKRNYRMSMQGRGRTSLYVDPYTAEIQGETTPYAQEDFFSFVRRLHRWFLFQMKRDGSISWGKMITGTSTLIFFFIVVTGVIIWVPKTLKMLKRRLSIKVNKGWFRFWYDLHLAGGIYAAIFLILFCLTGLTWSFGWYRTGFYKVFGIETTQGGGGHGQQAPQAASGHGAPAAQAPVATTEGGEGRRGGRPEGVSGEGEGRGNRGEGESRERGGREGAGEGEGQRRGGRPEGTEGNTEGSQSRRGGRGEGREETGFAVWNNVVAQLRKENPNFKTITIQSGSASVSNAHKGNTRASDRYTFDTRTGEITASQLYKDQDKSAKIRGWIYAVHVGSWGGMITRILSFIACLIGASLPITGYYFYFKKLWLKRKKHRKATAL